MRNVALPAAFVISLLLFSPLTLAKSEIEPKQLTFTLLKTRSHPNLAFTQGLIVHQQDFVESSGLYKQSFLQRYPIDEATQEKPFTKLLGKSDFAEGIAAINSHLWLITWQQGLARQFDINTFQHHQSVHYPGEGWGLTFDGEHLVMSDGSATLTRRNKDNFIVIDTVPVTLNGAPLNALNELEYAHGLIWANVWFQPFIYAIDPHTGKVVATLDLSPIVAEEKRLHAFGLNKDSVLNGIAYDPNTDALWVTGKRWRKMYLIKPTHWPQPTNR